MLTYFVGYLYTAICWWTLWCSESQIADWRRSISYAQPLSHPVWERSTLVGRVIELHQRLNSRYCAQEICKIDSKYEQHGDNVELRAGEVGSEQKVSSLNANAAARAHASSIVALQ